MTTDVGLRGGEGDFVPVGWIGAGRMGTAMAGRLLAAGTPVRVWNRTRARAEALRARGAELADELADLSALPVVFTMVMDDAAIRDVLLGADGLFRGSRVPDVLVDCSTLSLEAGQEIADAAAARGGAVLHAPVSGNPDHVTAGELALIASGSQAVFESVRLLLEQIAGSVGYAGSGGSARVAKICHNLVVGAQAEALAEALVVGEAHGVSRAALMEFIDSCVLGSVWTRGKTRALVELDFTPTFTSEGLRKDLYLAVELARQRYVSSPLTSVVAEQLTRLVGSGVGPGRDYASLLELVARDSGHVLAPPAAEPAG